MNKTREKKDDVQLSFSKKVLCKRSSQASNSNKRRSLTSLAIH